MSHSGPVVREGSLSRAIDKFKANLSAEQLNSFSICNQADVYRAVEEIQQKHGAKRTLKNMQRIRAFLEAMDHLGKSVEVFLNLHPFVCFIWGPIKFLLGVAQSWHQSLDLLLGAYAMIGDEIPGILHYRHIFDKYPTLTVVLEDYFGDILEFHTNALFVFNRPAWEKLFRCTWKTFNSRFDPILTSLRNRRQLLDSEKASVTIHAIEALRDKLEDLSNDARDEAQKREAERHEYRMRQIRDKLNVPDYELDRLISTEDIGGQPSGQWLFERPEYTKWADTNAIGHEVLYIHAIPGAGKTTLMTTVINKLHETKATAQGPIQQYLVLYFYCKYDQKDKQSFGAILQALLDQILRQDQALSDDLLEEILLADAVKVKTTEFLTRFVQKAFASEAHSFVIIDGLDECSSAQACATLDWFISLTSKKPQGSPSIGAVRVLFSGQRDGLLDQKLAGDPSIALESSRHLEDVRAYCEKRCASLGMKFKLNEVDVQNVISKVTDSAQGMFLFARIVLDNLISQTRRDRFRMELDNDRFPTGIEKAYDRVFFRVIDSAHAAEKEDAEKILNWVICAKRPLRWREVQATFCIDPEIGNVDYQERHLLVTCKELCGAFVDVHHVTTRGASQDAYPEGMLKLVHQTAQTYLINRGFIDLAVQNTRLARYCMQYLTTTPFVRGLTAPVIVENARDGYYGLQDYAVAHWFDHLKPLRSNVLSLPENICNETLETLAQFLVSYGVASQHQDYQGLKTPDDIHAALLALPGDHLEMHAFVDIELRTSAIRRAVEESFRSNPNHILCEAYINLHGTVNIFKCPKPWCDYFSDGFGCDKLRRAHTNRHDLPFQCSVEACFASKVGFDKEQKLQRHLQRYHDETGDSSTISFPMIRKQTAVSLSDAIKKCDYDLVKDLLDAGKSPNGYTRLQTSPVYQAAEQGHFEIFKLLLERGANLLGGPEKTERVFRTHTVLNAATRAGSSDIVNLVISKLSLFDLDVGGLNSPSPLTIAAGEGCLDILQQLLVKVTPSTEFGDDLSFPDFCTHRLLPAACGSKDANLSLVKYITEDCPVRLNDRRGWVAALSVSAGRGHYQLVDLLLSIGDTTHRCHVGAPLLAAIRSRSFGIARTLLAACDSRIGDFPQLHQILVASCEEGMPDIVGLALSCPTIDISYREDRYRSTPLLAAVKKAHVDIVEVLLGRPGVDITSCTGMGISPFLLAMINWSEKIIVQREKCVALLKSMRYHGPLHLGSISGRADMAKVVDNALALRDADITDAIMAATEAGDDGQDLMYLWLSPAIKRRQLDLAGRLLAMKSVLSQLSTSAWEDLIREISAWKNENEVVIQETLLATTKHYLMVGQGLYLISILLERKSLDIAKMCIPATFSATSVRELRLEHQKALVRDIVCIDEPDILWPMIKTFTDLGFGDILLWASLHRKEAELADKRCATIEALVDRSLANINIRKRDLPKDGVGLLGLRQGSLEGLGGYPTPLQYVIKAGRGKEVQRGSLEYYILSHDKVDVNTLGEVTFLALTPSPNQCRLSMLLARGADPNACDGHGISLLETATERGNLAAVKLILATGKCDQRFRDRAAEMASTRGYNQILRELQTIPGRSGDQTLED